MPSIIAGDITAEAAVDLKIELLSNILGEPVAVAAGGQSSYLEALPEQSNIVGFGIGPKITARNSVTNEISVKVYVKNKIPRQYLSSSELVPLSVNGLSTDVIPVGDILASSRPTFCGVSASHKNTISGTIGCLVAIDGQNGSRFILSCNHVLANSNLGAIGDAILEPSPSDGGDVNSPIAELSEFAPINFDTLNVIDAAIARLINVADVNPQIFQIGKIGPPSQASIFQSVRKSGRSTLQTVGTIDDVSADIKVYYGSKRAKFHDQLVVRGVSGAFAQQGDSGALVVDALNHNAVGMVFAVGGEVAFVNKIQPVLNFFSASIITE
jgi:hypothetical protein